MAAAVGCTARTTRFPHRLAPLRTYVQRNNGRTPPPPTRSDNKNERLTQLSNNGVNGARARARPSYISSFRVCRAGRRFSQLRFVSLCERAKKITSTRTISTVKWRRANGRLTSHNNENVCPPPRTTSYRRAPRDRPSDPHHVPYRALARARPTITTAHRRSAANPTDRDR